MLPCVREQPLAPFPVSTVDDLTIKATATLRSTVGVSLVAPFSCANKLKDGSSSQAIEIEADCLFLYCSNTTRTVYGKDKGVMAGNVRRVHLECTKKTVQLAAGSLFALGDSSCESIPPVHYSLLCHWEHTFLNSFTPCKKVYLFVSTDAHLLKLTQFASYYGAAILRIPKSGDSELRTFTGREFLCDVCKTRAISEGNQWFRMAGDCPHEKSGFPNRDACDCVDKDEENEEHDDYIFVPECSVNNLQNNPIADALRSKQLELVWGAPALSSVGQCRAYDMKKEAMKRMKAGEPVTIPHLMEVFSIPTLDEFLGLAKSNMRLADFIADNKSFTLSKVNGFIENPEAHKVGPWLDGRLATGENNVVWHIPHVQEVVIETHKDVSSVRRTRSDDDCESDPLGSFIR